MSEYKLIGLYTSKGKELSNGQLSAINKESVSSFFIGKDKIKEDECIDQKHHGGDMRVVHHYSLKNYQYLKENLPDIAQKFIPGSFGENICTEDITEEDLCIGDIFTLGSVKLQVTVPRRPCATINANYEDQRVLKHVIRSGHVGWFYRVLEEGKVYSTDVLKFHERLYPDLKLNLLFNQGYRGHVFSDHDFLKKCFETGLMDKGWRPKLDKMFSE